MRRGRKNNILEGYNERITQIIKRSNMSSIEKFIDGAKEYSVGYNRADLPQIEDEGHAMNHLMTNWDAVKRRMKIKTLQPSQNEFSIEKIEGMYDDTEFDPFERTYFVDMNDRLLDGHHTWAYGNIVDPNQYVSVVKVPHDTPKVKEILNKLGTTVRKGINEGTKAEYQKAFNAMLKKYGVKSIGELDKAKKAKFFKELDKSYTSEDEEKKGKKNERMRSRKRRVAERKKYPEKRGDGWRIWIYDGKLGVTIQVNDIVTFEKNPNSFDDWDRIYVMEDGEVDHRGFVGFSDKMTSDDVSWAVSGLYSHIEARNLHSYNLHGIDRSFVTAILKEGIKMRDSYKNMNERGLPNSRRYSQNILKKKTNT